MRGVAQHVAPHIWHMYDCHIFFLLPGSMLRGLLLDCFCIASALLLEAHVNAWNMVLVGTGWTQTHGSGLGNDESTSLQPTAGKDVHASVFLLVAGACQLLGTRRFVCELIRKRKPAQRWRQSYLPVCAWVRACVRVCVRACAHAHVRVYVAF